MGWAVGYSPPPGYAGLCTVDNQLLIKYTVQLAISVQHDQEKASFLQQSLLHDFGSICTITSIVIVITFYSPSCLGQETAKGPFDLRVKLPPAHLSTTHGGGFTLSL